MIRCFWIIKVAFIAVSIVIVITVTVTVVVRNFIGSAVPQQVLSLRIYFLTSGVAPGGRVGALATVHSGGR